MDKRRMGLVVFLLLLTVGCMTVMGKESVSWDGVTLPDDAQLIFFSPQLDWVTYERQNALWLAPLPNVEDKVKIMRDYTSRVWAMHTYWMPNGTGFLMQSHEDIENDRLGTQTWWLTAANALDKQIPLCTLSGVERVIKWAPDSTAFAAIDRGGIVTIVYADGSGCKELPPLGIPLRYSDISWSPDGQRIAYPSQPLFGEEARQIETRTVNFSTYETTTVYANEGDPIWFPDGDRIGLLTEGSILVLHANGSGLIKKIKLPDGYVQASIWGNIWSPDGSRLALSLRASGPDSTPVAIGILDAYNFTFSVLEVPDFYQIVGWVPNESAVVVSRYEGSNLALREVPVAP